MEMGRGNWGGKFRTLRNNIAGLAGSIFSPNAVGFGLKILTPIEFPTYLHANFVLINPVSVTLDP